MHVVLLAHGAADSPWFGIAVVAAAVVAVVFVLAVLHRIDLREPGDLLLPAAGVVLFAGLGGAAGDAVADQVVWAGPLGVVLLVAVVLAASTPLELSIGRPLGYGAIALGVVAGIVLSGPLDTALFHEQVVALPQADDAEVEARLLDGPDDAGRVSIELAVTGGTLNDAPGPAQDDPEQAMVARFVAGPAFVSPDGFPADCSSGCTTAVYDLVLPPLTTGGFPDRVRVELLTADQLPFSPPITATVELE